jgi:gamma-glutamyltranspeptidase/glutathione hydrolase
MIFVTCSYGHDPFRSKSVSLIRKRNLQMTHSLHDYPYVSCRMPVFADNLVATSQPLAAQAGVSTLQAGGNAIDAALAAAIALIVVEPTGNGLGGDAFAIVWDGQRLWGVNGSGRSPAAWSPDHFAAYASMPENGWDTVTVPGAIHAWYSLWRRLGKLPFEQLFEPAIHYAANGFAVSPYIALKWHQAHRRLAEFDAFSQTYLPKGRAPRVGERFFNPDLARTLRKIACSQTEAFYHGAVADEIIACSQASGGCLTHDDLAAHQTEWVDTIHTDYNGFEVHELPPNGQGIAVLIALSILQLLDIGKYPVDSPDSIHLQIEAMKQALHEVATHVADPQHMQRGVRDLLSTDHIARLASRIERQRAFFPSTTIYPEGGTVYLCAADADGMMVSYIQSNYIGFGSGIVIPHTGISMQNRGLGFVLQQGHPNQVGSCKKPLHTIIPGFVMHEGKPLISFGVMGGHMQAQGHVQVLTRMLIYGQNPQSALDASRWFVHKDYHVSLEDGHAPSLATELQKRQHVLIPAACRDLFGGGQIICRADDSYLGASDGRKDGQTVGY